MKKRALILFSIVSCIFLMVGCSEKKQSGTNGEVEIGSKESVAAMNDFKAGEQFKATEPITVSIMYSDHPNYPWKKDWLFVTELKKMTNVTLDPVIIPMSDYEQKRSLLISSGDAPDIIAKTYPGQENAFVSSGVILPISEYLDYMPNFMEKVKKWGIEKDLESLRQADGQFYVLPGLHEEIRSDYTLTYRTDILEENGLEVPETWDDFYKVLKVLKEKYPDKTPFSDRFQGKALLGFAAPAFGVTGGWGYNPVTYDEENGEFVYTGTEDGYKEMLEFFNKLVKEGLMDKESFTQEDETAIQKFVNGDSFVMSNNGQTLLDVKKTMEGTLGEGNFEVEKGLTPEGPAGALIASNHLENGLMFPTKLKENPNFKAILQFVDWLWYSDKGEEFAKWGVEGVTYTKENGKYKLTDDINFKGLNPKGKKDLQKDFGFSGGNFSYGGSTDLVNSTLNDAEVAWINKMINERGVAPTAPPAPFDMVEQEEASLISTPIKDYVDQSTLQFIVGQRNLSDWSKYVQEVKNKGSDKYVDMVNEAKKRYEENNK